MHALGNDLVITDRFTQSFFMDQSVVRSLGNRHTGIGFDQLIVIEPPLDAEHDFSYQIYNQQGEHVKQSLNALRCLGRYVYDAAFIRKKRTRFQLGTQSFTCDLLSATVSKVSFLESAGYLDYRGLIEYQDYHIEHVFFGDDYFICWDIEEDSQKSVTEFLIQTGILSKIGRAHV